MERLFDGLNHIFCQHFSVFPSFLLDAPISPVKFKVSNEQTEGYTAETNG